MAKTKKRYNQVPHLTQDTIMSCDKSTKETSHIQVGQEASHFSADDHKAAMNRQGSIVKTNVEHK